MNNADEPQRWLVLTGGKVVLDNGGGALWDKLPFEADAILQSHILVQSHPLVADGAERAAVEVVEIDPAQVGEYQQLPIRQGIVTDILPGFLLHQAASLVNWGRQTRFCSRCGGTLGFSICVNNRARICSGCGFHAYPSVSPCIIVLIYRDDEILLAQGVNHPGGFHSLIAGYVEPGETLEQAVAREVFEETGLTVCDIQHQNSQPWPFSHNLMVGFTARYHSGSLVIAKDELIQAGWYGEESMPALPPLQTISRQLIDSFWHRHQSKRE